MSNGWAAGAFTSFHKGLATGPKYGLNGG
jgi:hypothetical protein